MTEEKIGRYIIEKTIGEGAMGMVYKAYDPILQRTVAIKTIRIANLASEELRETFKARFFREARIAGNLQHPNIVILHDLGEHQDMPFIVMEYVEGDILSNLFGPGRPLTKNKAVRILTQIANALETAHDLGIIHRDIKPDNIRLTKNDLVKILDFGIAKMAESEMTITGEFLGTPKYSSPEQIKDEKVDHRSDLFSLGVVAHELLTGISPFPGSSINSIFFKIVNGEPDIAKCDPKLAINDSRFRAIFKRALHKDPGQRYQKATDFTSDLKALFPKDSVTPSASGQVSLPTPPVEDEGAKKRELALVQLRARFQQAVEARDPEKARDLIVSLEKENAEVVEENQALEMLVAEINGERKQKAAHHRAVFAKHLAASEVKEAEEALKNLKRMDVSVDEEVARLNELKQQLQEKREREYVLNKVRKTFEGCIKNKDVEKARAQFTQLERLQGAGDRERRMLQALEDEVRKANEAKATEIRKLFDTEIDSGNAKDARTLLENLKQLGVATGREEKALSKLERSFTDASRQRQKQVKSLRDQLHRALHGKSLEKAEEVYAELKSLNEDLVEDAEAIQGLRVRLEDERKQEDERKRAAEIQELRDQVDRAEKARDIATIEKMIGQLNNLGEDTSKEAETLARVQKLKKDEQAQSVERQRSSQIQSLRDQIRKNIKLKDGYSAEKLINQLKNLDEDVTEETAALKELRQQLQREVQLKKERQIERHEKEFHKALKRNQVQEAREAIKTIAGLGGDIRSLESQLKAADKEAGKVSRPKAVEPQDGKKDGFPTWALAGVVIGLILALVLLFFLLRGGKEEPPPVAPQPDPEITKKEDQEEPKPVDPRNDPTPTLPPDETPEDQTDTSSTGEGPGADGTTDGSVKTELGADKTTEEPTEPAGNPTEKPDTATVKPEPDKTDEPTTPEPVTPEPKKMEPPKIQPKKPEPKRTEPVKPEPKKPEPKPGLLFQDSAFKAYLVENFDRDGDNELSPEEAEFITRIDTPGTLSRPGKIRDLTGIEALTSLERLECSFEPIKKLPRLPDSLQLLLCTNTDLEVFPDLPSSVKDLEINNNRLTHKDCDKITATKKRIPFFVLNPQKGGPINCDAPPQETTPPPREEQPAPKPAEPARTEQKAFAFPKPETNGINLREYQLLESYLESREFNSARKLIRRLGKTDKDTLRYAEVFSQYYYLNEDYEKVITTFGNRQPDRLTEKGTYYLGLCYFEMNNFARAKETLKHLDRSKYRDLKQVDKVINK